MNEERLILAVIERAVRDYQDGGRWQKDAADYFTGATYQHHITALGLLPGTMPVLLSGGRERGPGARPGQLSEQNATQKGV
jgi:hypothetical protein